MQSSYIYIVTSLLRSKAITACNGRHCQWHYQRSLRNRIGLAELALVRIESTDLWHSRIRTVIKLPAWELPCVSSVPRLRSCTDPIAFVA